MDEETNYLMVNCRHCDLPAEPGQLFIGPGGIMRQYTCVGGHRYTEQMTVEDLDQVEPYHG